MIIKRTNGQILLCCLFMLLLTGCQAKGSAGMILRVNPPSASIQKLSIEANNALKIQLRIQNFSTVPTTYQNLQAQLRFNTQPVIMLNVPLQMTIPALSSDVISTLIEPTQLLFTDDKLQYTLTGKIDTTQPKGHYDFTYEGQLTPVPGVKNTYR